MNPLFKASPLAIENEIYSLLDLKEGQDLRFDDAIIKISRDYYYFQYKILKLLDNQISISFDYEVKYNELFFLSGSDVNDLPFKFVSLTFDSITRETEKGIMFTSRENSFSSPDYSITISPTEPSDIEIAFVDGINCDNRQSSIMKEYFFDHLVSLNEALKENLSLLSKFLIPLDNICKLIGKEQQIFKDSILENNDYSFEFIYKTLMNNKDIINITTDKDITKHLEFMNKYFFNKEELSQEGLYKPLKNKEKNSLK